VAQAGAIRAQVGNRLGGLFDARGVALRGAVSF